MNPASPGAEVASYQVSGINGPFLGTHNCHGGGAGPVYRQFHNSWQPVAYDTRPTQFCILTDSATVNGIFNGDLAWD